jgi:hypothetical protein
MDARVARWFVSKPKFKILFCFEGYWFGEIFTWFGGKFWFLFGLFEGLLVWKIFYMVWRQYLVCFWFVWSQIITNLALSGV